VQAAAAPPSIAHVVVYGATPLETENVTFAVVELIVEPFVGALIVTTGPVVLTVHV
jgi:hypothetical protein